MRRGLLSEQGERRARRRLLAACLLLPLIVLTTSASGAAVATPAPISVAAVKALAVARATSGPSLADGAAAGPPAPARSASACGAIPELVCSQVDVPIDRTGQVPGTISLHVELLPAQGIQRGVMFLIAGGPGQGSAHVFDLGSPANALLYRFLFPGYSLVAYDDRGTGSSGLLDCPPLQTATTTDAERAAATACASVIGPQRAFYSTADHAEDLEAVRTALGFDRIGLFGVSYGTKLALAYSLAHPDHVDRLVLDSVLPPELPDPFSADVLRQLPATLKAFCSDGGCRAATKDFAGDVAVVANKLAAKPLQGKVLTVSGRTTTVRLDGLTFLSIVLDADLSQGLAAELPAVVHAARLGNTQPLLRLARMNQAINTSPSLELSFGLYAATVCRDGPFPWQPNTPEASRPTLFSAAVNALPPGSLGPFGLWAARFGNADFCLGWPSPSGGVPLGSGPLPNVPVLALSGGFDLRTPTSNAASVIARFPQGRLLVVPGIGHSVTTADPSACAPLAVRSWIQDGFVPNDCPRPKALVAPIPALPAPGSAQPKRAAGPLQTYAIATKTLREAEAAWLLAAPSAVPGIFGGKINSGQRAFTLVRYSIARGVWLSGTIRITKTGLPLVFGGTVTVGGPAASAGVLGLSESSLRGTLGGRIVG